MQLKREALVAIRTGRGIGVVDLANRAGITREALRKIERGDTANPHDHTIHALADALGVSVSAITVEKPARAAS